MQQYLIVALTDVNYKPIREASIYYTEEGRRQKVDLYYTTIRLANKVKKRLINSDKFIVVNGENI